MVVIISQMFRVTSKSLIYDNKGNFDLMGVKFQDPQKWGVMARALEPAVPIDVMNCNMLSKIVKSP